MYLRKKSSLLPGVKLSMIREIQYRLWFLSFQPDENVIVTPLSGNADVDVRYDDSNYEK